MYRKLQFAMMFLFVFTATAWAQQDPLVGTWKLNVAKTKYNPGAPPSSAINTFEASGANGVRHISERVNADGSKIRQEFTVQFDGKDYPDRDTSTPAPGAQPAATVADTRDAVSVDRIDPYTYRVSYKLKGKPVQMNYWSVSKDGRTLSVFSTGLTATIGVYQRMLVYDKQ